jgi:NAD(P)-dependent dehydrogenase (short-subunit alcohol dehydrogenase family)
LDDGWQVYAACRDPKSASELRRLADASDHKLRIIALDVIDSTSVKAAAAELEGRAIDVLINNAGVNGLAVREFEQARASNAHFSVIVRYAIPDWPC